MRRATTLLLGAVISASFMFTSCEDMMEVGSDRQAFTPDLNAKTDSVFYAFGIAQAMQQLADQYFFQGEMRGELVATTQYTDSMLSQLKNFSATLSNKYDSAYVYYRVINNCNYYIAHRDTTLRTGSTDVTRNEYVAVKAFRAWAYLQLARNYGKVPFYTTPLTSISDIDNNQFPMYDIYQIAQALCPDLAQYAGTPVPNYGTSINIGNLNSGGSKSMNTTKIFIPVDVILGDLYLETARSAADYKKAADCYFNYLQTTKTLLPNTMARLRMRNASLSYPTDMENGSPGLSETYSSIFAANNTTTDLISYIPMSVNRLKGTVTNIPYTFGYDYYALSANDKWKEQIQLVPSTDYNTLVDTLDFYYYKKVTGGLIGQNITSGKYGDMRSLSIKYPTLSSTFIASDDDEEDIEWINKFQSGNVFLYRVTTVYLHLCEALNRLGLPDAAFALLKEGLNINMTKATNTWMSDEAKQYFLNTFLNSTNEDTYKANSNPIHQHGCGAVADGNYPGASPYQYASEVAKKFAQLSANSTLYPGLAARVAAATTTKDDTIMAIEEMLCDEEAMEFCFEGTRWYDLMRFARHKNNAGLNGSAWLADKVKNNSPVVSLLSEDNWYLPFKK